MGSLPQLCVTDMAQRNRIIWNYFLFTPNYLVIWYWRSFRASKNSVECHSHRRLGWTPV